MGSAGQEDWGPADVGVGEAPAPAPQPKTAPVVPAVPLVPDERRAASPTVAVPASIAARSLARGLAVRLTCPDGCVAQLTLKDGKRTLVRRTVKVGTAKTRVPLRLTRAARRTLGRRGHRTLTLTVVVAGRTTTKRIAIR